MSALARTALRIAVVSALQADATIAAMCDDRVFDSRIGELDAQEPVPVIIVYTEDENGTQDSHNNGGPPFRSFVDLVFEISVRAEVASDDNETLNIRYPETDRELEIALDILEERAIGAATVADTPQSLLVRRAVTRRVTKMRSFRYVLPDSGVKLATRFVTLTTELKDFLPDDPTQPATGPFAVLPSPLRDVCLAQTAGTSGYVTCVAAAAKFTAETDDSFDGADMTYAVTDLSKVLTPPAPTDQVETFKQDIEIDNG